MFTPRKKSLLALLIAAPLAATPALAEQHTSGDGAQMSSSDSQSSATDSSGSDDQSRSDPLLATVGDAEITASDMEAALMAFPAQMRQSQPVEMLLPMAMEQLILRELVLQAAMADNMADDPEVQSIVEQNSQRTEEDAMVQVYVQRQLDGAVTDQAVQDTYDQITSNSEAEMPPLDAVRPQIEQQLRQQRLNALAATLQEGVEVVYYGPDGKPQQASTQSGASGTASGSIADGSSTSGSGSTSNSDEISSGANSVQDAIPETDSSTSSN